MKVSEILQSVLLDLGVTTVFGIPGREASSIDFGTNDGKSLEFVLARNEYSAAGMAIASSRVTGTPAACWVTLGPGVTHIASGVASAYMDRNPMIVLGAQIERAAIQYGQVHQCLDSVSLMKPVTKFAAEISDARELEMALRRAYEVAVTPPMGPVFLSLPIDLLDEDLIDVASSIVSEDRFAVATPLNSYENSAFELSIELDALERIAQDLGRANSPLIVVGDGVVKSGSATAVSDFAKAHRIPVAATYTAHGVITDESELYAGVVSSYDDVLLEDKILDGMFRDRDFVLLIGYDTMEHYPNTWRGRAVTSPVVASIAEWHAKRDAIGANLRYSGPIGSVLEDLSRHLGDKRWPSPQETFAKRRHEVVATPQAEGKLRGPEVIETLNSHYGRYRLASDIGLNRHVSGVFFRSHSAGDYLTSAGHSGFGIGLPYALGAWISDKSTPIVAVVGDGGLLSNLGELETAARLSANIVIVVLDSTSNALIERYQLTGREHRINKVMTGSSSVRYGSIAEATGIPAFEAASINDLTDALHRADEFEGPSLIRVAVDYGDLFVNAFEKRAPRDREAIPGFSK